jgi:hypothetical protein
VSAPVVGKLSKFMMRLKYLWRILF